MQWCATFAFARTIICIYGSALQSFTNKHTELHLKYATCFPSR